MADKIGGVTGAALKHIKLVIHKDLLKQRQGGHNKVLIVIGSHNNLLTWLSFLGTGSTEPLVVKIADGA